MEYQYHFEIPICVCVSSAKPLPQIWHKTATKLYGQATKNNLLRKTHPYFNKSIVSKKNCKSNQFCSFVSAIQVAFFPPPSPHIQLNCQFIKSSTLDGYDLSAFIVVIAAAAVWKSERTPCTADLKRYPSLSGTRVPADVQVVIDTYISKCNRAM